MAAVISAVPEADFRVAGMQQQDSAHRAADFLVAAGFPAELLRHPLPVAVPAVDLLEAEVRGAEAEVAAVAG